MPDKKPVYKNVLPIKNNAGWAVPEGYNWMPAKGDKQVRDTAMPIIEEKLSYMDSPEYRRRLQATGNAGPDQIITARKEALKNIQFFRTPAGSSASSKIPWLQSASVSLASGSGDDVLAHEIGHVTGNLTEASTGPRQGSKFAMSPAEAWKFINKDKNLTPQLKKSMADSFAANAKFGQYTTDPATAVGGDPHDLGAGEAKADLDGFRWLLKKKGLVGKYGADIDKSVLEKAAKDKDIQGSGIYQRLKKRFKDEDIVDLNNTVASAKAKAADTA